MVKNIKSGDILISWSASLDVYKWQGGNAILNQHIFNTIINYDVVDYDFFITLLNIHYQR
ncbi:tRNA ligase [Francisella tularensis]|nr:tRNA ligase [Francisella tularensis]